MSIIGNLRYRPTSRSTSPKFKASDLTVVIPTTDIVPETFHRVVRSVLAHSVAKLVISTAGPKAEKDEGAFRFLFSDQRIVLLHREVASRREQTAHAMKYVDTPLLILQDDHTYWPNKNSFLQFTLAPFEEPSAGAVGVGLEARHRQHAFSLAGFWNFLGMIYLVRRHYEYCGTFGIDCGEYLNERVCFGLVGPLNVDDDKFHTRWLVEHDWNIKLQAGPETMMTTELGEWPKFNEQVSRWLGTSVRSNPRHLIHRKSWIRHPYTTWTLLVWFVRMSLVLEPLMFWLLHAVLKAHDQLQHFRVATVTLYAFITAMKFVKILAHFKKHPTDVVYFPGYVIYGYWCTPVKIWALLTWWNASWATAKAATSSTKVVDSPMMELCDTNATNTADAVTCIMGSSDRLGSCVRRRLERFVYKE
ncbi:hypothetical protein HBI56_200340 [Parastagonospora nodorum]|uniref:Glycosyltransferase 2-like domain-containing protein n=1 Tax=Phaeosphaeria nodorum (strain SN15 / ATCC MYA-4574 / FGSC 10173) TaxID=321614 RepID=A0A7U2EVS9_PHANO|nr:hypothetical protein HBH56_214880 [Parastagonospora nodorum]QRC93797.1 hypothetical protein JI435_156830 [Parastagonospora nodorum SN15]KAH3922550.1 hypothetical protein HBH54_222620 [Parastagonospora nodorum]KAH3942058.1 hypothetical protein HBH53_192530 [Parastagonospora nodorum]KAH3961374.1 hypothetical protein HBH51_183570 [Parastagonospora nodorum]